MSLASYVWGRQLGGERGRCIFIFLCVTLFSCNINILKSVLVYCVLRTRKWGVKKRSSFVKTKMSHMRVACIVKQVEVAHDGTCPAATRETHAVLMQRDGITHAPHPPYGLQHTSSQPYHCGCTFVRSMPLYATRTSRVTVRAF